jgi:signal transduction histidine kinase
MVVVMALGVIATQLTATLFWALHLHTTSKTKALQGAQNMAENAIETIRYYQDIPAQHRPILIAQLHSMGGTRFFVNANQSVLPIKAIRNESLLDTVTDAVQTQLLKQLKASSTVSVAFAWPSGLPISDDGRLLDDLPASWTDSAMLLGEPTVPMLVIQAEIEPNQWLYLTAPMPDPYFLAHANPFTLERIAIHLLTLATVLLLTVLLVRDLVKPLNRIAFAANAFGSAGAPEKVPETGTAEMRRMAEAFNEMQARIQGYLLDRERLFLGISHGLKTPIMRLRLRTELFDEDDLRAEFNEDLDDLDMMVKSSLQSLKDTDIHENITPVRLDTVLQRLTKRPIYPDAKIGLHSEPITIEAKPLALERALSNLIDNGVLYGERVQIRLSRLGNMAMVEVRDFGPGIPRSFMTAVFDPRVRLSHGQKSNRSGTGLGMGIARNIVQSHGGEIRLHNHAEGGLVVTVLLPALEQRED